MKKRNGHVAYIATAIITHYMIHSQTFFSLFGTHILQTYMALKKCYDSCTQSLIKNCLEPSVRKLLKLNQVM